MLTKRHLPPVLAVVSFALASSCVTLTGSKNKATDPTDVASGAPVVQQAGAQDPVVSPNSRSQWLKARSSDKNGLAKIQAALATGEAEAATELARAYLAKHPNDVQALSLLASGLAVQKRYELAAYYARLLDKVQPGHPVALNVQGLAILYTNKNRMSDYKRAAQLFQQAFQADDKQIAPGMNLGSLQLEMGNARAAMQTYTEVVERCGRCSAALLGYGVAASRSRQFDAAEQAFSEILKKSPNHSGALFNLALVFKNGYNKPKEAEKYLNRLIASGARVKGGAKDVYIVERAHSVLRSLKGEASVEDRKSEMADEKADGKDDPQDAELLMSGAEKNE